VRSNLPLLDRQQAFGYSQEDITILMTPMASTGEEAAARWATTRPISALSDKPKQLFTYFKQNFAQVTNPPIDPIREELVMSLVSIIGPRPNLFDLQGLASTQRLEVRQPILTDADLEKIRSISDVPRHPLQVAHPRHHLPRRLRRGRHGAGARRALRTRRRRVREGINIIILSDRMTGTDRIPIPSLLACAAVHHHLIRTGLRTSVGLVGRIRRAARGASLRLPGRLRRPKRSTLSRVRDHPRDEGQAARRARRLRRSSSATSSRSARACSR